MLAIEEDIETVKYIYRSYHLSEINIPEELINDVVRIELWINKTLLNVTGVDGIFTGVELVNKNYFQSIIMGRRY